MDREGFRNRLKQYKEARGQNPQLKYWEWKETPKFVEGGEVTGPPTYEQWQQEVQKYNPKIIGDYSFDRSMELLKNELHDKAMQLPGYSDMWGSYQRTMPKNDPDLDEWVTELWANENPNKLGYRNGKYYPHKSPEGGKATIGPGFKLGSGAHSISEREAKNGVTRSRLDIEARKSGITHLNAVNSFINYRQDTNPADTVSPQIKMGLMDLRHQVGSLNEWSGLREAVLTGDLDKIREESTVTWKNKGKTKVDTRRKKLRDEKYFHYAEGTDNVQPDPLEVLERSKPRINGIPINDRPLSGTDPVGEAMMWGLGGGAASAALRSMFPTYGATAGWLAFGDNDKDNMLVIPNNPTKNTTPIETGLLNKEVRQYYADDVLPRDILTSEADKLKFLNTDKNFEYDLYSQGYFSNGVAGHYDRLDDKIRLNGGYIANKDLLDNVMAHEVNHRYNREFPLDKEHNRILNRAYTVEPELNTAAARAARKESEKRATNVNIRHKLQTDLRNTLGRKPTKAEMDEFIDSLSDQELLDRLGSASSYGSAYLMSIEERSDLVNQPADQYKKARATGLRKALKRIAMNENKNDNNQNYA